jgi:4-hydroxy-tetrahydrodipicolinate synthase
MAQSRAMSARPYRGGFATAPTLLADRGELDLDGQRRGIDVMIAARSQGICGGRDDRTE